MSEKVAKAIAAIFEATEFTNEDASTEWLLEATAHNASKSRTLVGCDASDVAEALMIVNELKGET